MRESVIEPLATKPDPVTGVTWLQLGQGSQPVDVVAAAAQTIASRPIEKAPALTVPANDQRDFPRVILIPLIADPAGGDPNFRTGLAEIAFALKLVGSSLQSLYAGKLRKGDFRSLLPLSYLSQRAQREINQ